MYMLDSLYGVVVEEKLQTLKSHQVDHSWDCDPTLCNNVDH